MHGAVGLALKDKVGEISGVWGGFTMGAGTVATHLRTLENVSGAGSQMLCRNAKARGKHCENGPNVTPYPTTTSACGLGNVLHSSGPLC